MRRLYLILVLLMPMGAMAQPDGVRDLLEDPEPLSEGYTVYVSGGDTAWVNPETGQWKAVASDKWYLSCPGASAFRVGVVADSMEAMVRSDSVDMQPQLSVRLGCVINFDTALDTLLSWHTEPTPDKGWAYADECITSVNNATVHGPNLGLSPGDTVAVYKGDTCAGYNVATGEGVTVAAAGSDDVAITQDGYAQGNALRVEVYDTSEGSAYRPEVVWASCDTVDVPVCEEGTYREGSFHQIASLHGN